MFPCCPAQVIRSVPLTNFPKETVGGGKRVRTADPLLARQVLSQLSYTPKKVRLSLTENKCPDILRSTVIKNE